MKTQALQNLVAPKGGGLTLIMGEETGGNITASLMAASFLARDPRNGPVLYLNTIQTPRKLGMTIRSGIDSGYSSDKKNPRLIFHSVEPGLLAGEKGYLQQRIEEMKPKTIIINSLDFASKDYRRKEELIFTLMQWLAAYDLNIIIFSEMRKSLPKPGKIQRGGGVGKLAAIAEEVRVIGESGELGESEVRSPVSGVGKGEGEISGSDFQSERVIAESGSTDSQSVREVVEEITPNGQRVRSTGESKEISLNGLRVRSTGIIDTGILEEAPAQKPKHVPMSNKNRALVAEYEKLHGKALLPGESFRDMFDRIVGVSEKLKANSENGEGKKLLREMLTV